MDLFNYIPSRYVALSALLLSFFLSLPAQVEVLNGIDYEQISRFESNYSIIAMKMSGDGSTIVFATGGPAVKVYTLHSDGTNLTEVFDFERTGTGPMIDISANGQKVIWCDGEGEIYIANTDGSNLKELATLLPNPDPNFADMEPLIPLPPRITADGNQVYFIHMDRNPEGSGVWKVNSDDTGLTRVFNYLEMAQDVFGTNGDEYNYNTAFADGFDISADGSRMIVGTRIFKLAEGDLNRGDAIAVDGTDFYHLGEYATGYQPFSTYVDGDQFIMFRREYNPIPDDDEINVYFVPLGTGDPVKVIAGLGIFGTAAMTQMASDGSYGIIQGANGRLPITRIDRLTQSRLDLVTIDGISIAIGGFRFSESVLPSISWDGDRFCFLAGSTPPQIWMASINSDAVNSQPSLSEIQFDPDEVAVDASTKATLSAHASILDDTIHTVTFDVLQEGKFIFRALTADYPGQYLYDDGNFGDPFADDGYFTNNTVRADLPETPLGEYTIRIAALAGSLTEVSAVDAGPFFIKEPASSSGMDSHPVQGFKLYQNFPNPFRETSVLSYELLNESRVELKLTDLTGKDIQILVKDYQMPGPYQVEVHAGDLPPGIYLYSLETVDGIRTQRLQVIH